MHAMGAGRGAVRAEQARRENADLAPGAELDEFRQAFVAEYLCNGEHGTKAIHAARKATGKRPVKDSTAAVRATELLNEAAVARVITERRSEAVKAAQITEADYYRYLHRLIRQASGEEPVLETEFRLHDGPDGELVARTVDVAKCKPHLPTVKGALELVARGLGLYREQHEVSGPGSGPIQFQAMSDEELQARAAELASRAGLTIDGEALVAPDDDGETAAGRNLPGA
jgi:hypothetical protein